MKVKGLIDEDICNYKKTSMFVIFPVCSFKCDKEHGAPICQNSSLAGAPTYDIEIKDLILRYMSNPLSKALICAGLEPFDTIDDLAALIQAFRAQTDDDIVIYTGYRESELEPNPIYHKILSYPNIIIKYGRFIPNDDEHFDEVLGINLASKNQYAKQYNMRSS